MTFKAGDVVDYHARIGGPVTSTGHEVESVGFLSSGHEVAWITGKIGHVAIEALSPSGLAPTPEIAPAPREKPDRALMREAMHMLCYVDASMKERTDVAQKLASAIGHEWPPYPDAHDADHCPYGEAGCDQCR